MFFFFKQKTAYEMRISDWSSDVCSSDLIAVAATAAASANPGQSVDQRWRRAWSADGSATACMVACGQWRCAEARPGRKMNPMHIIQERSEEHTSELQSLMRISYAVFCLKKKTNQNKTKMIKDNHKEQKNTQSE